MDETFPKHSWQGGLARPVPQPRYMRQVIGFLPFQTGGGEVITPARQHAEAVQTAAEGVDIAVDGEGGVAFGYKLGQRKADAMSRSLDRFTK